VVGLRVANFMQRHHIEISKPKHKPYPVVSRSMSGGSNYLNLERHEEKPMLAMCSVSSKIPRYPNKPHDSVPYPENSLSD
jgi:hypothetical protein